MRALEDLLGNRDGLWHNEHLPAGDLPSRWRKSPRVEARRLAWSTGLATQDETATLQEFLELAHAHWDGPLTALDLDALPGGRLFAVHKVFCLLRSGRHARTVQDTFVRADLQVAGLDLPPREVFVRAHAPTAAPSGHAVVVVPGHAVSGAAELKQVDALCAGGHAVYEMTLPWQGPLRTPLSRGFELMRDVAAVVAQVQAVTQGRVGLLGSSVGGGVGVLGAMVLASAGLLPVDMSGVNAVLQAPWLGCGWCFAEPAGSEASAASAATASSRRPDIAALTKGAPRAATLARQLVVLEDTFLPVDLEARLEPDLDRVLTLMADGALPQGRWQVFHATDDPFADIQLVRHLCGASDGQGVLHELTGANHLLALDEASAPLAPSRLSDLLSSTGFPTEDTDLHGAARDRTLRFLVLAARVTAGVEVLPEEAHELVYLTVPGLFTERYPGYMVDKFARMSALGLDHHTVPIDTDAGVETNAHQIRDSVLEHTQAGRQAVLIGHSKGGNDLAAALSMFPQLRARVRAVVTLQAPWLGTPIADRIEEKAVLSWAARFIVEDAFKGEASALTGLATRARAEFIARHPWPQGVPAVCLATSLGSWSTLLKVPDALLGNRHGPTDGFVPISHAVLPGSDAVFLRGVDHGGVVLPRPLGNCAHLVPGDVIIALVALALEKAASSLNTA